MDSKPWFVYILRCADNSLYTGITVDVDKRLDDHNGITKNGARYTQSRRPVTLAHLETASSRSEASKREHTLKSLSKNEKEQLISDNK